MLGICSVFQACQPVYTFHFRILVFCPQHILTLHYNITQYNKITINFKPQFPNNLSSEFVVSFLKNWQYLIQGYYIVLEILQRCSCFIQIDSVFNQQLMQANFVQTEQDLIITEHFLNVLTAIVFSCKCFRAVQMSFFLHLKLLLRFSNELQMPIVIFYDITQKKKNPLTKSSNLKKVINPQIKRRKKAAQHPYVDLNVNLMNEASNQGWAIWRKSNITIFLILQC